MTKTELKKQQVKAAIELLENEFGAKFDGTDEGGRLGFMINDFMGQFSRRDMNVALWDTISLHGRWNFSDAEIAHHEAAVALEKQINEALGAVVTQFADMEAQSFETFGINKI